MNAKYYSRRQALKVLAATIGIPLLESISPIHLLYPKDALGAPIKRTRFIGCFWGAGAYMPDGQNGDWVWDGALKPLSDAGHRSNLMIMRGFKPQTNFDWHWAGTCGFLSGGWPRPIKVTGNNYLDQRGIGERCMKSFDQYVADLKQTKYGSLQVGWQDEVFEANGQTEECGLTYVNSISWRNETSPNRNINNPVDAFNRIFSGGGGGTDAAAKYRLKRRQSILDGVKSQYGSFQKILSGADQKKLTSFLDGLRDVERDIATELKSTENCGYNLPNVDDPTYQKNFKLYNRVIVRAMECNAIASATIMYQNGIGDFDLSEGGHSQHGAAHNAGDTGKIETQKRYNRIQMTLLADLVTQLKAANIFDDTLIMAGSNMSDGDKHVPKNIPMILLGAARGDIKFGQEVNVAPDPLNEDQNRKISDLLMDLAKVYGVNVNSFGEGDGVSTGKTTGIFT